VPASCCPPLGSHHGPLAGPEYAPPSADSYLAFAVPFSWHYNSSLEDKKCPPSPDPMASPQGKWVILNPMAPKTWPSLCIMAVTLTGLLIYLPIRPWKGRGHRGRLGTCTKEPQALWSSVSATPTSQELFARSLFLCPVPRALDQAP
jgi:hypothetical protein